MRRLFYLGLVGVLITGVGLVYHLKHRVEDAVDRVAQLQRMIDVERESISLLRAEWSMLSQPANIQALIERHAEALNLTPLQAKQIVTFDTLPPVPADPIPESPPPVLSGLASNLPAR